MEGAADARQNPRTIRGADNVWQGNRQFRPAASAPKRKSKRRLSINYLQRDLTDKYLLRDLEPAMAYTCLGFEAVLAGLEKIAPDEQKLRLDLEAHWEVIAEGIQTILRAEGYPNAYEKLKEETRGRKIGKEDIARFIDSLEISKETKMRLRQLSPTTYLGYAIELTAKALDARAHPKEAQVPRR